MKSLNIILVNIFLLLSIFSSPGFASDDAAVNEFEKFIAKAESETNKNTVVYLNQYSQQWAKRRFSVSEISYDVKKTDSLISPVVGLVNFKLVTEQTDLYPIQKDAQGSNEFDPRFTSPYKISLVYIYKNKKWSLSKGTNESMTGLARGKQFEITEEKINNEPTATPYAALKFWLPN